jgi:hypothetical protein
MLLVQGQVYFIPTKINILKIFSTISTSNAICSQSIWI